MKLILEPTQNEAGYNKVCIETPYDALNIADAAQLCRQALIAWGFSEKSVDQYIESS